MEQKKALLYGFAEETPAAEKILKDFGIPAVVVGEEHLDQKIGYLCGLPGFREEKKKPGDPIPGAAVVFRGVSREELDPLLKAFSSLGTRSLKAMVTPTNSGWPLRNLLREIAREQKVMGELMKLRRLMDAAPMPKPGDLQLMMALMQAQKMMSGGEDISPEQIRKACDQLEKALNP